MIRAPWFLLLLTAAGYAETVRIGAVYTEAYPELELCLETGSAPKKEPAPQWKLVQDGTAGPAPTRERPFKDSGQGIATVVVLDASGSMSGAPMTQIREGLADFVDRARPADRVLILSVADDTRAETKWEDNKEAQKKALTGLVVRGSRTLLLDAIEHAGQQLLRTSGLPLRRHVLAITDGHDEGSKVELAKLTRQLQDDHIVVDALLLTAKTSSHLADLETLARATGGGVTSVRTAEKLREAMGQGIDAVMNMPVLAFAASSKLADGQQHRFGLQAQGHPEVPAYAVRVPEAPLWRGLPVVPLAAAGVALAAAAGWWLSRRKSPVSAAASGSQPKIYKPPAAAPDAPLPPPRKDTESDAGLPSAHSAPHPGGGTIRVAAPPPAPPAAPRPRQKTQMRVSVPQPSPGRPVLWLRSVAGPRNGEVFGVDSIDYWIGAEQRNNLAITSDQTLSGVHARIRYQEGNMLLHNLSQTNGTWVNGKRLSGEGCLLMPGDHVQMGASQFIVAYDQEA